MNAEFTITISGSGETIDDCWNEAVVALSMDPGETPDEDEYTFLDEDGDPLPDASC